MPVALPDNIYTSEQREYVDALPNDAALLKSHLLHQVRLRDLMEADRNAFEKENNKHIELVRSLRKEVVRLSEELKEEHPSAILEFRGPHRWLSNFTLVRIKLDEPWAYRSTEHAYMAQKSDIPDWKIVCRDTIECKDIRRLGQSVPLRRDWDTFRIQAMRRVLELKFEQEPFRSLLLRTGTAHLQEGNQYGDTFWGVDLDTGKGYNHLGKLIMEIRTKLRHSNTDLTQGL